MLGALAIWLFWDIVPDLESDFFQFIEVEGEAAAQKMSAYLDESFASANDSGNRTIHDDGAGNCVCLTGA